MKKIGELTGFVFGILLILGAAWLAYIFITSFRVSEASVQSAIIAATAVVFSAIFAFVKERSKARKEAHREKKIEVYTRFYDWMFEIMKSVRRHNEVDFDNPTEEMQAKWQAIAQGVMFYGSPDVVKKFSAISLQDQQVNNVAAHTMRKVGRVLLAMREDIGLSNKGLDEISIHQVYVRDDLSRLGLDQ